MHLLVLGAEPLWHGRMVKEWTLGVLGDLKVLTVNYPLHGWGMTNKKKYSAWLINEHSRL